jgi:hypothetical protein
LLDRDLSSDGQEVDHSPLFVARLLSARTHQSERNVSFRLRP